MQDEAPARISALASSWSWLQSRPAAAVGLRWLIVAIALITAALLCIRSYDWATRDDSPRDFGSFWESGR
ncbi:MAG TPA: hypothetical protein VH951_08845, partial [Dehalococcoidia bacterium]